jgi:hypothetical protein
MDSLRYRDHVDLTWFKREAKLRVTPLRGALKTTMQYLF